MFFFHSSCCDRRYSYAYPRGDKWRFIIERHSILIKGDMCFVERFLCFLTCKVLVPEVDQHEVVVRSIADEMVVSFYKSFSHCLYICNHLFTVICEIVS